MKISCRSTRPTEERSSWRCVPSAQSNRSRSPPRRTRIAAGARCAVGIDPDVPRKTRSRSTRPIVGLAFLADLHVTRLGDGPPAVFVHGSFGWGEETWSAQRPLADDYELLLVD